jgi:hypothetical protein
MSELTVPSAQAISDQASQVRFLPFVGRVITTVLLGIVSGLAYVTGSAWFSIVFLWLYAGAAWRYGFSKGARVKEKEPSLPGVA